MERAPEQRGEWPHPDGEFVILTDPSRLDVEFVHRCLEESYWSPGIPLEVVRRAIENSLSFGVYNAGGRQVGFGRVITDRATFAYLADVFIIPEYRSRGLSKWLMSVISAHSSLQGLRRWVLATRTRMGCIGSSGSRLWQRPIASWNASTPRSIHGESAARGGDARTQRVQRHHVGPPRRSPRIRG